MKSLIQAYRPSQDSRAFGVLGLDDADARCATVSRSPAGAPIANSKNDRLGSGRAKASMNSHEPSSMKSSMSRVTRSLVGFSHCATAAGVK